MRNIIIIYYECFTLPHLLKYSILDFEDYSVNWLDNPFYQSVEYDNQKLTNSTI